MAIAFALKSDNFWKYSLGALLGGTTLFYSVHRWNEYYRQRNEIHPITRWIMSQQKSEDECRQQRIAFIKRESKRALRRIEAYERFIAGNQWLTRILPSSLSADNVRELEEKVVKQQQQV